MAENDSRAGYRLIGLVSIGNLVKIQISEIEMEGAATEEYTA
jgi:hypothetical protein